MAAPPEIPDSWPDSLADDAQLLRRVRTEDVKVDSVTGLLILSDNGMPVCASNAFQNETGKDAFSVLLRQALEDAGLDLDEALEGKSEMGLVAVTVGLIREQDRLIKPAPHANSPAGISHFHVTGPPLTRAAAKRVRQSFAMSAQWVRLPPRIQLAWEVQIRNDDDPKGRED